MKYKTSTVYTWETDLWRSDTCTGITWWCTNKVEPVNPLALLGHNVKQSHCMMNRLFAKSISHNECLHVLVFATIYIKTPETEHLYKESCVQFRINS